MQLQGKRIIITGAGAGLGRDMALRFAAEGAQVMVSDLDLGAAENVAAEIRKAGGTAHTNQADVTREDDVRALVEQGVGDMGGLDCMVNNAGIEIIRPVTDITETEWDKLMAINVKGTFFGCKYAVPHLVASRGNIINLASVAGLIGWPLLSLYCASKGAVVQMTKSLAQEFKAQGVRVNALCPMVVATEMGSRFVDTYEQTYGIPISMALEARQGRLGRPDEVSTAAVFLASDAAGFINGVALPIDNGGSSG